MIPTRRFAPTSPFQGEVNSVIRTTLVIVNSRATLRLSTRVSHLAGEERIGHPLVADAGAGAVAADEADIVAERAAVFP
jgi:hypothetical protein